MTTPTTEAVVAQFNQRFPRTKITCPVDAFILNAMANLADVAGYPIFAGEIRGHVYNLTRPQDEDISKTATIQQPKHSTL
jgi:hypothetical protein